MKKHFFFIPLMALLGSCATSHYYYQICEVSSELPISSTGAYEYKNSSCDITYDFWSEGGAISFIVKNNTKDILYVDLSKSFLIKNGIAYDYYLSRTISSASAVAASLDNGVASSAFGSWNYLGNVIGSQSVASSNSITSQRSSSVTYEEKSVVAIPPFASKVFSEYYIMSNHFTDCDLFETPSKQLPFKMSFDRVTTPVSFTNYICYRVGDSSSDQFIENSFYISEVSNQHHGSTIEKVNVGCSTDYFETNKFVFIKTSPKEFFIRYTPRAQTNKRKSRR